jgi:hypothetical protein
MPSIEQLADQLNSGDQQAVYKAKLGLLQTVSAVGAPAKRADRQALAAELAKAESAKTDKGAPKYSARARGELARAMSLVAGEAEVPALKAALADFSAREMARFALERITCQAATDALVDAALNAVGVEFRIGAVNALARRSTAGVVEALKKCAADTDAEIRLAAAEALAHHADAAADAAIVEAGNKGGERGVLRTSKARLRLAETLAKAGQKDAAQQIYRSIAASDALAPQKKAAQSAMTARAG